MRVASDIQMMSIGVGVERPEGQWRGQLQSVWLEILPGYGIKAQTWRPQSKHLPQGQTEYIKAQLHSNALKL